MTNTWVHPQLSTRLLQDLTKRYMTNTWVHPQLSTRLLQDLTKSYMTNTWVHPQLSTRLLQDLTKSYMTSTWVHPQLSTRLLQDLTKSYMTNTWVHPQFFVIHLFSFLCGVFVLFLSVFILCIVPNVVYVSGLSLLDSHFNIPLRSSKTNLSFHVNRCFTLMDFKCNHFLAM
ncbi:hypothetical protein BBROOKSOX_137 [Bathymodiolus brooksi thiotrophic gill symbiont]|nr:hypothetical protein BBROOKSOX_137 [Bathymodiolus brooksi thiotrophic gill symbiont]